MQNNMFHPLLINNNLLFNSNFLFNNNIKICQNNSLNDLGVNKLLFIKFVYKTEKKKKII